jgi:hypothetical protein
MFCCFLVLVGIRSFPACDPKIASEHLPLYQRGPGGFIEIPPDPPFFMGNPPQPPFFKGGGMFCCFRKLAGMRSFPACDPFRHAILSGMRSEDSLRISLPFAKAKMSPPLPKGAGGISSGQRKPQISPPFVKGAGGIYSNPP